MRMNIKLAGNFRPWVIAASWVFAVSLLSANCVSAQENKDEAPRFRLGALEIHPGIDVSVKEDTNVFLTNTDTKSDTIMTYVPTVKLSRSFGGESDFDVKFKYEIIDYDKFGAEDTENKTVTGNLNFEKINGNGYWRTNGIWEDTADASSSETQTTTGPRTPRTKGEVDSHVGIGGYDGSKLRLEVSAGLTWNRYLRAAQDRLESDLTRGGALVEYAISPKTNIRVDYEFERQKYTNRTVDDQRDNARDHAIRAGFSFTPSALITGHATLGFVRRTFDETISTTDESDRDTNNISADVDLTWKWKKGTTVNGTFKSTIASSSTPGQVAYRKWDAGGTLTQDLPFISNNLKFTLNPSYEKNIFIRNSRIDSILKWQAGFKYTAVSKKYPWFASFDFKDERKSTNENKSSVEYHDNTYEFKVGLQY